LDPAELGRPPYHPVERIGIERFLTTASIGEVGTCQVPTRR
jgi:hypothetical protein